MFTAKHSACAPPSWWPGPAEKLRSWESAVTAWPPDNFTRRLYQECEMHQWSAVAAINHATFIWAHPSCWKTDQVRTASFSSKAGSSGPDEEVEHQVPAGTDLCVFDTGPQLDHQTQSLFSTNDNTYVIINICHNKSIKLQNYAFQWIYIYIHCSKKLKEHFENTSDLKVKKYYVGYLYWYGQFNVLGTTGFQIFWWK